MSNHWLNSLMQSLDFVLDMELTDKDRLRLETARILIGQKLDGTITKSDVETWGNAGLEAERRY